MKRECQKKGTDKNRTLFSVVKRSEREKERERENGVASSLERRRRIRRRKGKRGEAALK